MTVVISLRKWGYLPYWSFCLVVLIHFAGACKEKKSISSLHFPKRNQIERPFSHVSSFNQVENDGSNTAQPPLPTSEQVQNSGSNTAQPSVSSLKQPATDALLSEQEEQISITSRAHAAVDQEKEYRKNFSQELSAIKDLSERDKRIGSFIKKRNQRIEAFNTLLQKVGNSDEKQRLIADFQDIQGMCDECNCLNEHYAGVSDPIKRKQQDQELGDIVEKYNGYAIESKRQQIRGRVKKLFKSTHNQDAQCAICHKTESVGLLPCDDYVHVDCLVEAIIARFRMGPTYWVLGCPGACGNYLGSLYFLIDRDIRAEEYLTLDKWKEIFFKPTNSK